MRSIKFIIGAAFAGVLMLALFTVWISSESAAADRRGGVPQHPEGARARFGRPARQVRQPAAAARLQVYSRSLRGCHSLGLVSFRELKGSAITTPR
jgi:hypothetical protein